MVPLARQIEHVTLTCGCAGITTWRVAGLPACGVVITSTREGCDEHVPGRRKLISLETIAARRYTRRRPRIGDLS